MASTKNELVTMWSTCLLFFSFCFMTCNGHGRLIDPPGRASAWRFGFKTPPDYNDHELYCGGFTRQWKRNGGKCGECGDAWDIPEPRPHEFGGQWGQGLIVRSYEPGSNMTIRVELTASHMGYFEFRLCPNRIAKQSCFDQNLLRIIDGFPSQPISSDLDIRFYPRNGSRIYEIQARLPELTCDQCVLQWRYVAGNNWGICSDGNEAIGCGPQEEFRSCSDISLTSDWRIPKRPLNLRPTPPSKIPTATIQNKTFKNSLVFVVVVILFFFLCALIRYTFIINNECCTKNSITKFKKYVLIWNST
ncbi:uncharacterized protein LOC108104322 isoform X1 [Drosophila eugracilis]|uniref:uncharacterized protein LOC108104322 isoform X1 n=1 Tax=Drosophila eugracilis TaxID=29029 RepID=UPI001BD9F99E|nr:uncharacterized protein LOC108104322 isoform X1 [Drosophila eugracilis]